MTAAFELNDAGILVATAGGGLRDWTSPGVARLTSAGLLVGMDAAGGERLQPTHTDQHFWTRLRSENLPAPFPRDWSSADLAHAHLEDLRRRIDEPVWHDILLAIPGSTPAEDLPLLLGVARAAGLEVTGLVDSAVAALVSGRVPTTRNVLHVELEQHRAVLTQLRSSDRVLRGDVEVLEDCGILSLRHRAARFLADLFVRQTRFDPLHSAETEQQLHSAIPGWLGELDVRGEAELSLSTARGIRSITLGRSELVEAVVPIYSLLAARLKASLGRLGGGDIVLSHRADAIPELRSYLRDEAGADVHLLDRGAAVLGTLREADQIRSNATGLRRIVELSVPGHLPPPPAILPPRRRLAPSHVLIDGVALPLDPLPAGLGTDPPDPLHSLLLHQAGGIEALHVTLEESDGDLILRSPAAGTFVDDRLAQDGQRLFAGDRLRLGDPGLTIQFITLGDPHGTA